MNRFIENKFYAGILAMFILTLLHTITLAQTATSNTTITTSETVWYMQPWAWVAGAIVLLFAIITVSQSNSNADKVTYSKNIQHR